VKNKIVRFDGYVGLCLTQGKITVIDESDYDLVKQYRWCASNHLGRWYAVASVAGRRTYLHRLLLNSKGVTDHRDGDGLNNRRSNLRDCTQAQNAFNRAKVGKSSTVHGVYFHKNQWCARIRINGQRIWLGGYKSEQEAKDARVSAEKMYYPNFDRVEH